MTRKQDLVGNDDIFEPCAYDYYDYDAMEKLHESRSRKYIKLIKNWHNAKEKNNEEAMKKALKAISKHKEQDEKIKGKCQQSGYYWY